MMDLTIFMNIRRFLVLIIMGAGLLMLSGCSSATLPWPEFSIDRSEADEALTKSEQSLLEELLSTNQKNHQEDAVREIEKR